MDVILGALYAGLITGGIVVVCGAIKGKLGLAMGGFCCCLISALLLGLLLAIPVCGIFLCLIFKNDPKKEYDDRKLPPAPTNHTRFCCNCGNHISPNDTFCNRCGSRLDQPSMNQFRD